MEKTEIEKLIEGTLKVLHRQVKKKISISFDESFQSKVRICY